MRNEFSSRLSYPDPMRPSGIEFDLPEDAYVTLKIFDQGGKEVVTLVDNDFYHAGTHNVELIVSEIGAGMYFYRLSARNGDVCRAETKNIVVGG